MTSARNARIAASFGARAGSYESHAALQCAVAERLAGYLPRLARPRVLELGCGTGLLTRHLFQAYPDGDFLITDLSPAMLSEAAVRLCPPAGAKVAFDVLDAAEVGNIGRFDLIVTSMSLHWLSDPVAALQRLRRIAEPGGRLHFAGLGPGCFAEWRAAVAAEGLQDGIVPVMELPGLHDEKSFVMEESGLAFLQRLRAIGGLTPREGYAVLSPGMLRRVLRRLQKDHGGRVTWRIVYGCLSSAVTSSDKTSLGFVTSPSEPA